MQLSQYRDNHQISDDEALDIRRKIMSPTKVLKHDAEALIRLNEQVAEPTAVWKTLFIEAIADYMIDTTTSGYIVNDEKATWLIDAVQSDGRLDTETEFNLLIKIINKANIVSPKLEVYMLSAVKDAIIKGRGTWSESRQLEAGKVTEDDVELLRRIMYAVGGEGGIDISREEAEIIYDIHDATADADNHASWGDMFSKMMACYMMSGMSAIEVSEAEAIGRDVWLKSDEGLDFSIDNIVKGFSGFFKSEKRIDMTPAVLDEPLQSSLEAITEEEAYWLIDRINRDGRITPYEAKMLYYLKHECPDLHDALDEFIQSTGYR